MQIDSKYIGSRARERMKETEFYVLSHFLAELRYNATPKGKRVEISEEIYMGDYKIPAIAVVKDKQKYANSLAMLAEIQIMLEGLALKEVT